MDRAERAAPSVDLDDLKRRIDGWRLTRRHRRPMPEELWREAAQIARVKGINRTASALGLNYYGLKERAEEPPEDDRAPAQRPAFVEVDAPPSLFPVSCEVEVESAGEKMKVRLSGPPSVNVVALLDSFWSRRR